MVLSMPGNVRPRSIEQEMRTAYLDYAMSVIVSRALPDVRDGLKPVQRRILYAMHGMGLRPNAAYKKCAGVVGEVLGKFHPHGDSSVYDSLVRMAQDFSLRYPLVRGQGNFGSVDNDPPAAMRYTEARLAPIAEEMLVDIDRATVDFGDNYDGSQREPLVLPARLPNLLVNGASGIAVGMATNIPPHNLREICEAVIHLIDNPDAAPEELLSFVQGPDFPTGGIIMGREGIQEAFATGHGRIMVRARATVVEEGKTNPRTQIVVSELPYQVNKASLVEKIATLAKEKRIEGISEIRDESDREGMRMVVELQRFAHPDQVLNNLYKHTSLQSAFHVNMVSLVDGQPRLMGLQPMLLHYIEFRRTVVRRRAEYDLGRARDRVHILEGLRTALLNLDEVVALIRGSQDVEGARRGLMSQFGLTEIQAQAILDMQLRRLAALEREKLEAEYQELVTKIAELEALLADPQMVMSVVKTETEELRQQYGDERRTEIWDEEATNFSKEELTPHADVVITLSERGYVKRLPIELYRLQRRGGKGVRGQETREGDAIHQLVVSDTHDWLLFFTDKGRVYRERVFNINEDATRQTRGTPVQNLINIDPQEHVTALVSMADPNVEKYIVMATRKGEVKRMRLNQFANIRSNGLAAMDLEKDDYMLTARLADPGMSVIIVSRNGKGVQFAMEEISLRQTRSAGGVRGIRLIGGDTVVAMDVASPDSFLLILSEKGYGKRTAVKHFRTTGRNVQGVIALKINDKTGPIAAAVILGADVEEAMVGSSKAMVYRTRLDEIRQLGRATQGVKIMTKLRDDDKVISLSAFKERAFADLPIIPRLSAPATNGQRKGKKNGTSEQQLELALPEGNEPEDADEEFLEDELEEDNLENDEAIDDDVEDDEVVEDEEE
jgi:DNA gyrase subunit A